MLIDAPPPPQVTDYAIARRSIVDLHSHKTEAVERVYSLVSGVDRGRVVVTA